MTLVITFLAALFGFGAIIGIHELGHFTVAKLCGIQVNEFSIGMGPALWKKIHNGTQYSLRALPVGGYVAMEGEESPESQAAQNAADARQAAEENPVPPELRTGIPFNEAPAWQRALVMVAGAFMNFVLGFLIMVILVASQSGKITSCKIYSIEEGALCGQTGLAAGDEVLAVNGRRCFVANDMVYELVRSKSCQADFTVRRNGETVELKGVQFDTQTNADGSTSMSLGFKVYGIEKTPFSVTREAAGYVLYDARLIYSSLVDLLAGRESVNNLSGPVGIVSAIGKAASYGWRNLLDLLALITINLGIFNLLPFPALDGGKVFFLLIEAVTRRAIPQKIQTGLTAAAFLALFALMIFATYNDILRLAAGEL